MSVGAAPVIEYIEPATAVSVVPAPVVEYSEPKLAVSVVPEPVVGYIETAPDVLVAPGPVVEHSEPASAMSAVAAPVIEFELSETTLCCTKLTELLQHARFRDTRTVQLHAQECMVVAAGTEGESQPPRVIFCENEPLCFEDEEAAPPLTPFYLVLGVMYHRIRRTLDWRRMRGRPPATQCVFFTKPQGVPFHQRSSRGTLWDGLRLRAAAEAFPRNHR